MTTIYEQVSEQLAEIEAALPAPDSFPCPPWCDSKHKFGWQQVDVGGACKDHEVSFGAFYVWQVDSIELGGAYTPGTPMLGGELPKDDIDLAAARRLYADLGRALQFFESIEARS